MSFPTNWNVDKYFNNTDVFEHWILKREFMLKHQDKFPEEKVVTFARLFYNIEFLGCVYNKLLMKFVDDLSNQVEEIVEYRKQKSLKLQRTFVKASDAVKRYTQTSEDDNSTDFTNKKLETNFIPGTSKHLEMEFQFKETVKETKVAKAEQNSDTNKSNNKLEKPRLTRKEKRKELLSEKYKLHFDLTPEAKELLTKIRSRDGVLGKMVIYEANFYNSPFECLDNSAKKSNVYLQVEKDITTNMYKLKLDKEKICECSDAVDEDNKDTKKKKLFDRIKNILAEKALEQLKQHCFTIMDNNKKDCAEVNTSELTVKPVPQTEVPQAEKQVPKIELPMDGIGARMMKRMGWQGQGLGKDSTGIVEPVKAAEIRVYRRGFGEAINNKILMQRLREYFRKYLESGETKRLIFSSDFTKDDRASVHQVTQEFVLLKSKSYGKNENRYITVERKLEIWEIVQQLLANGGTYSSYTLVKPTELQI